MTNKELLPIIEGLLFISGDEGIDMTAIQEVLIYEKPSTINKVIDLLIEKYEKDVTTAFSIQRFHKNKFRLQTKPELHDYLAQLNQLENHKKLSTSVVEVLSIIAYRGPVTKGEVDDLRNADSAYQLQKLREQKLIQAIGKSEENPRANVYQITDNFYKVFNLSGFDDLPKVDFDALETNSFEEETETSHRLKGLFNNGDEDSINE